MKLYAFQPTGHGQLSLFTIAESSTQAFQVVDKYVKENGGVNSYDFQGWGTDDYEMTELKPGQVITNNND